MGGGFQVLVEQLTLHSPSIPAKDSCVCSEMESTAVFLLSPARILWKDSGTLISPEGEMLEEQRAEPHSLAVQGALVPAAGISLMALGCANPLPECAQGDKDKGGKGREALGLAS